MANAYQSRFIGTIDPPVVLDASVTSIPGSASATLQVVNALPDEVNEIRFVDGIGQYVGVYTGPLGQEVLIGCLCGNDKGVITDWIPKGTRISVRNLEAGTISTGTAYLEFCFRAIR